MIAIEALTASVVALSPNEEPADAIAVAVALSVALMLALLSAVTASDWPVMVEFWTIA